jgi:hypothetical protein
MAYRQWYPSSSAIDRNSKARAVSFKFAKRHAWTFTNCSPTPQTVDGRRK